MQLDPEPNGICLLGPAAHAIGHCAEASHLTALGHLVQLSKLLLLLEVIDGCDQDHHCHCH